MRVSRKQAKFDSIDLEIFWNQIITLIDETAYAVRRTSMRLVTVQL